MVSQVLLTASCSGFFVFFSAVIIIIIIIIIKHDNVYGAVIMA